MAPLRGAHILVVDDDPDTLEVECAVLEQQGCKLDCVENVDAALAALEKHPVDLVITDVNMPRMDGITLVSELRQLPAYRLTPVLLLTTESSMDKKMEGKKAGATGWIVKPFNPAQLLATLSRVL